MNLKNEGSSYGKIVVDEYGNAVLTPLSEEELLREKQRRDQRKSDDLKLLHLQDAEAVAKEERDYMVEWFSGCINRNGNYGEQLLINSDGSLNDTERGDGSPPVINNLISAEPGVIKDKEWLLGTLQKIGYENPDLRIETMLDPDVGSWIGYRVTYIQE